MKKFMWLILLASVLAESMYGAKAAEFTVAIRIRGNKTFLVMGSDEEPCPFSLSLTQCAQYKEDLTAESRLLYPFSSVQQMPFFYRIPYTRDGQSGCIYLLGTYHIASLSNLPRAAMHAADQATSLLTEINLKFTPGLSRADRIKKSRAKNPVTNCLKKDRTLFVPPSDGTGWLSIIQTAALRERLNTQLVEIFGTELVQDIYHIDPSVIYGSLLPSVLENIGIRPILDEMDVELSTLFCQKNRNLFCMESPELVSKFELEALELGANDRTIEYLERHVWNICDLYEPDIAPHLRREHEHDLSGIEFYNRGKLRDYDGLELLAVNRRNQYWIETTLEQVFYGGTTSLVAVGFSHLDMGSIPGIGKTGLLNFFQALHDSGKTWNGIQVNSIERLMGINPYSGLTSERNKYKWTPVDGISTEGPYLARLMASL